jgi:hypothetical protein
MMAQAHSAAYVFPPNRPLIDSVKRRCGVVVRSWARLQVVAGSPWANKTSPLVLIVSSSSQCDHQHLCQPKVWSGTLNSIELICTLAEPPTRSVWSRHPETRDGHELGSNKCSDGVEDHEQFSLPISSRPPCVYECHRALQLSLEDPQNIEKSSHIRNRGHFKLQ